MFWVFGDVGWEFCIVVCELWVGGIWVILGGNSSMVLAIMLGDFD